MLHKKKKSNPVCLQGGLLGPVMGAHGMEGGLSYSTLLNVTFLLWFMRYYAQILTFAIFFIKNLPNDCSIAVNIGATSRPYSIEILLLFSVIDQS